MRAMLSLAEANKPSSQKTIRTVVSSLLQFDKTDAAFKDFKSGIVSVIKSNLDLLDGFPLHHDLRLEDVRSFLEDQIKKDLTNDLMFEKSVEINRYSRDMLRSMDAYFKEIFDFHKSLKDELYMEIIDASRMYLNSDLPLSFLNSRTDSLLAEIEYIATFDKIIHKERLDLIRSRNNRVKFKRICDSHNDWVRQFAARRKQVEDERVRLLWYVDFNNSKTVDEIFKDKFLTIGLVKASILEDYISRLEKETEEMERLNFSKMKFKPILEEELDNGTRTLLGMMHILEQRKE